MPIRFDFTGRLDGVQRTPQGGIRARAVLTRAGVFSYGDHKELRHPEDVFHGDAIASLRGAPLSIDHKAHITPANFRKHAVGHVADDVERSDSQGKPDPNGQHVVGTLFIQDEEACQRAELGRTDPDHADALVEISCGYQVTVVPQAGEYQGEKHDSRQIDIRYNHVAMGRKDWGRAGRDVRLVFDNASIGAAYAPNTMTLEEKAAYDKALKDAEDAKKRADAIQAEADEAKARADKAQAELDTAKAREAKEKADSARKTLLDAAKPVLGDEYTGKDTSGKDKSDRDVKIEVIGKTDSSFSAEGKSDAYLDVYFDLAIKSVKTDGAALATLNVVTGHDPNPGSRDDAAPADKARKDMIQRNTDAWKRTNPMMTRKSG